MHERRQSGIGTRLAAQAGVERVRKAAAASRKRRASWRLNGAAAIAALLLSGGLAACGTPQLGLGAKPLPAAPNPKFHPSTLWRHVEEQSPLCEDWLPRPSFYSRSAEMRPNDTLAVAVVGRCLASPAFETYRVVLVGFVGAPHRADAAEASEGARLALERAARVEQTLVDNGVAPRRISITTAQDEPDLDGRVEVDLFR